MTNILGKWGCILFVFALPAAGASGAEPWWQAKLDQTEAFNEQQAATRSELWAANPGAKDFKPFSEKLVSGGAPVTIRVKLTGIRKIWIGTSGPWNATAICGDPVWVDADGNRKPVTSSPPTLFFISRSLAPGAINHALNIITKDDPPRENFSLHAEKEAAWKPDASGGKAYTSGIRFSESQALFDVPEGTEWFEADVWQPGAIESPGVQFMVALESQQLLAALASAAAEKIDADISKRFNSPRDMAEQFQASREHMWDARERTALSDVFELGRRMAEACPPDLRAKAEKLRPFTRGNLVAVRSLYDLGNARKRIELCRKTADLVAGDGGDVAWAKSKIAALESKVAAASASGKPDGSALFGEAFRLRRKILFAHPALQFKNLLINKNAPTLYSHNCDQYLGRHSRIGQGPTLLTNWQSDHPKEKVLLKDKLPPGAFYRPCLDPGGKKFVFAFADHSNADLRFRRYFLYEAAADGSWVRQLTGRPEDQLNTADGRQTVMIEDSDPCYLPDGGIAFVSTRSQGFGRCHGTRYTPSLLLYRCDKDGNDCRQISFGIENETTPSVMNDGRILYTRWEYIDRSEVSFHKLWTTRPDGSGVSAYYGNDTIYPLMISEAKAIPGSKKVIATAMAHHTFHTGTMIMVDVQKGENGPDPVTRITPEINFPESNEPWGSGGQYATPCPLTENLFFATFSPASIPLQGNAPAASGYSIVLVDTLGGREPIFRDSETSCFSPAPVVARPPAPALASVLPEKPETETGVYVIENVNLTRNDPEGILKPGQIKALRFNRLYTKTTPSNTGLSSRVNVELAKRILGTVPVGSDGSVIVRVPAGVPLQIQALDENGMAVMTERSFHYLHPGEYRGCLGCHADSKGAPPAARASMLMRKISELAPPAGPDYPLGFSFAKTIQPVLDRYCIGCHGLGEMPPSPDQASGQPKEKPEEKANRLNLIGNKSGVYLDSYVALTRYTNPIGLKRETTGLEKNISRPMDYYAHGSQLGKMLLANHQSVNLSKEGFERIINWLDLNSQGNGDPSHNRIENARIDAEKEKALREAVKARFGDSLARQPYAALVNHANPDESRVLMAPLAKEAGGWGQIAGGWTSKDDPEYRKFREMVVNTIIPPPPDIDGTCGRPLKDCVCNACWIRFNKLNIPPLTATPKPTE